MATTQITKHSRIDIYEENDAQRIVDAQNARSPQSFPTASFDVEETADKPETKIYVYAFTSPRPINLASISGVDDIKLLGKARFDEDFDWPRGEKYINWAPKLSGSLRLTMAKKRT